MPELDIRETCWELKSAVDVSPIHRGRAGKEMWSEIEGVGKGGSVIGVGPCFGRTPFEPVFGWERDTSAFEIATETVKVGLSDRDRGVGYPVLIVLRNGAVISLVLQEDLHRALSLEGNVGADIHVSHANRSGKPFIPSAVTVGLEAGIGYEIVVEQRQDRKRRRADGVG